ncbi:MAG TPA: P-loop NTPase [Gemmatimonadaceae bacterium]|nr:P-loop NTPase [Gemmatimonadaceae bacterium]
MRALLVTSGKGGVGTSTVASLAALAAAERGERTLLVDATEAGGSLHLLFGVRPAASLWMLADHRSQPAEIAITLDERLSLVPGGTSGPAVLPATDHERRAALARLSYTFDNYDIIIIDGGNRLDTVTAVTDVADPSMLLVTSADRLALAANYALVKAVHARRAETPLAVISNRHGEAAAREACEYLVGACAHFLGRTLDVVGCVPDDPCLQAAIGAGMTVRDALEGSPAADAMRGALARTLPWSASATPAPLALAGHAVPPTPLPLSRRWS